MEEDRFGASYSRGGPHSRASGNNKWAAEEAEKKSNLTLFSVGSVERVALEEPASFAACSLVLIVLPGEQR